MSDTADTETVLNRRAWIGLAIADVVLFALANVTANNSSHPGTASNIFFVAFVIGTALLIVLGVVAVVRSRRRPAR